MSDDHLQRLLLEQANVRCVVAHLDSVQAEVLRRGRYPDALARLLGESLVVAALCSSGVKFEGRVSLQLRASGAVKLLMADCTDDGGLRGLARFDPDAMLAVR
ncbi:MAG TPA: Hsp33 family molecular chaperone HslO, partial [Wenzhouxiangellaceae bacterium]|nr:Hsp33 family molecular chaperone HslO [Wenzhouxiangellaceae bacterium]